MLNSYLLQVQSLLQSPPAPNPLYSTAVLTAAINEARVQVAGEGQCVPQMGTLTMAAGNNGPYPFSAIAFPTSSAVSGIAGPLNVRTLWFRVGTGQKWLRPRSWPWFSLYHLNSPVPQQGPPAVWAQYGQGTNGSLYFNAPDIAYTLSVDTVCVPIPLVDDTTIEAIPPLWQTAVQYYSAYVALLASQTGARMEEADQFFKRYELFIQRARMFATSDVLPGNAPQNPNPVRDNQLGLTGRQGASAG